MPPSAFYPCLGPIILKDQLYVVYGVEQKICKIQQDSSTLGSSFESMAPREEITSGWLVFR